MTTPSLMSRTEKTEKFVVYFTFVYITVFSINGLIRGNVEFIYYTAVMLLSIAIILFINKHFHFYPVVLMSLSLLGLLHLLGGNAYIGEIRLYDLYLIPGIFKYDNFVHMTGSAIMTMLAYAMLNPIVGDDFKGQNLYFILLLVAIAMGLGSINEIIEFVAVLVFDVSDMVGGYTNTLLDLIFNTIGSIIMAVVLMKSKLPLVIPRFHKR